MNESDFNQRADALLLAIEQVLDDSGVEVDYETVGGVLTIHFTNKTVIVINRQLPLRQIWVAAKAGGFHFSYSAEEENWFNTQNEESLYSSLSRWCSDQAGEIINFSQN